VRELGGVARAGLGVAIPHFGKNLSRESVLKVAVAAEKLGYDSVWTTDHVVIDPSNYYLVIIAIFKYELISKFRILGV
jgi:alkanesulfonate monooxygenase SsuD/methylene tetrahydromethanopterin reductase-like flavin-dependent oxidoreductase (luciferase family)